MNNDELEGYITAEDGSDNLRMLLSGMGFKQATPKLQNAINALVEAGTEDGVLPSRGWEMLTYAANTWSLSISLKAERADMMATVKNAASGREIWWLDDPSDEWHSVEFLFGEEDELLRYIANAI